MKYDDFETKDNGVRAEYKSGMVRDTQEGKPRFDLMFVKGVPYQYQIFTRFAALLTRGAEKYGSRNWEAANSQEELDRFLASAMRHMAQYIAGETDEDHAAAVMFNLMAAETVRYKMSQQKIVKRGIIEKCRHMFMNVKRPGAKTRAKNTSPSFP